MNSRGLLPLRQPDDLGVDHDNEFVPVVFRPSLAGRETAWLGSIMVGEIMQAGWGQLRRAQARIDLPGTPRKLIGADNMHRAKRALVDAVREWIPAAGLR
jgi:hypothetical protein